MYKNKNKRSLNHRSQHLYIFVVTELLTLSCFCTYIEIIKMVFMYLKKRPNPCCFIIPRFFVVLNCIFFCLIILMMVVNVLSKHLDLYREYDLYDTVPRNLISFPRHHHPYHHNEMIVVSTIQYHHP